MFYASVVLYIAVMFCTWSTSQPPNPCSVLSTCSVFFSCVGFPSWQFDSPPATWGLLDCIKAGFLLLSSPLLSSPLPSWAGSFAVQLGQLALECHDLLKESVLRDDIWLCVLCHSSHGVHIVRLRPQRYKQFAVFQAMELDAQLFWNFVLRCAAVCQHVTRGAGRSTTLWVQTNSCRMASTARRRSSQNWRCGLSLASLLLRASVLPGQPIFGALVQDGLAQMRGVTWRFVTSKSFFLIWQRWKLWRLPYQQQGIDTMWERKLGGMKRMWLTVLWGSSEFIV